MSLFDTKALASQKSVIKPTLTSPIKQTPITAGKPSQTNTTKPVLPIFAKTISIPDVLAETKTPTPGKGLSTVGRGRGRGNGRGGRGGRGRGTLYT